MFTINTFNKISSKGLALFARDTFEVSDSLEQASAYLLRSHKLHDAVFPDSLCAIARAGAGVNNIPIERCNERGIVVFNTPGANANAVKELVLAALLLGSRGIVKGIEYAKSLSAINDAAQMNKQVEAEKKQFAGRELAGKTLGVVGLGAIGSLVAEMALSLNMHVIGYDPAISVEAAWRLPSSVKKMESLEALLAQSDYISLHVPAIEATKHLINETTLNSIKPGAVLLNFARESIVDAQAIAQSLNANQLGQYLCDFPEPCLLAQDNVTAMPHIGASTQESEENCAVMAANQLIDYLENGNIRNSVNFPAVSMERAGKCRLTFSNTNVSGVLSNVLSVFTRHNINVIDMVNKSRGELAYNIIDIDNELDGQVLDEISSLEHVIAVRLIA